MKKRICTALTLLSLAATCFAGIAQDAQAYGLLGSKWGVGPNNAYFFGGEPKSAGAVTWSAMPSGVSGNAPGYDGHPDLSTDIEFLITPAADGLEYALFDQALSVWGAHGNIDNLGQVADSGADTGASEALGGHIGDIRAAGFTFDGPGGGLAHALQPAIESMGTTFGGDVHFDIGENWTNGGGGGTDFLTVAIHELGHSLGLDHSNAASVMQPFYAGVQHNLYLDDIQGIQAIYGTDFTADASFDSGSDQNVLNIDFGLFSLGDPVVPVNFDVSNLHGGASTSILSHSSTISAGDTSLLTTTFSPFSNLLAGDTSSTFSATFDTSVPGMKSASYDLNFTDNVSGGIQTITLNLTGEVAIPANTDDLARPDLVYDTTTGEVWIDPRDIGALGLYLLTSDNAFLDANHTPVLGGVVTSLPQEVSEASFTTVSTPQSIGLVLSPGLSYEDVYAILTERKGTAGIGSPEVEFDIDITCGAGDADCNGYVEIGSDILVAFSNFTGPGTFALTRADGDIDGFGVTGDDDVDVSDILTMFSVFTGPPDEGGLGAAEAGDPNIPDLIYDPATGEVILDPDGSAIIGYSLKNLTNSFAGGSHTPVLGGVSTSLSSELAEAALSSPGGPVSIGFVFPLGLDLASLTALLSTNEVSRSLGAPLVPFDLVVVSTVPEPSALLMAAFALGAMCLVARRRSRRS